MTSGVVCIPSVSLSPLVRFHQIAQDMTRIINTSGIHVYQTAGAVVLRQRSKIGTVRDD